MVEFAVGCVLKRCGRSVDKCYVIRESREDRERVDRNNSWPDLSEGFTPVSDVQEIKSPYVKFKNVKALF